MSKYLASLQGKFMRFLAGSEAPTAELQAGEGVAPEIGLDIYGHAYGARLREALQNDHPALCAVLGPGEWDKVCAAYIAAHPSRETSLRSFGNALPDFLREQEPYALRPLVVELAQFERRLLDSFDAAEAPRASWDALLALPQADWPGLSPRMHPSFLLHAADTNAVATWLAINDQSPIPDPTTIERGSWAIWRDGEAVTRFQSIGAQDAKLLQHFQDGGDFAGACERLQAQSADDDVPARAIACLRRACDAGWIASWQADA